MVHSVGCRRRLPRREEHYIPRFHPVCRRSALAAAAAVRALANRRTMPAPHGPHAVRRCGLAQQLDAIIGDSHAIADAQAGRNRLPDRGPAAVVVPDTDLIYDLRLRLLDLVAGIGTANRTHHCCHRAAGTAAHEAAQTTTGERADNQAGAAGILLLDDFTQ